MTRFEVLDNQPVHAGWRLIRLTGPSGCRPGQWLRLQGGHDAAECVPVYHVHAGEGWLAVTVPPTSSLAGLSVGSRTAVSGPFGATLPDHLERQSIILGMGAGAAPAIALAETLAPPARLVILDAADGLPVRLAPSRFLVAGIPPEATAGVARLEQAGIPSRIADPRGEQPGGFEGEAVTLLRRHAAALEPGVLAATALLVLAPWNPLARWQKELNGLFAEVHLGVLPTR